MIDANFNTNSTKITQINVSDDTNISKRDFSDYVYLNWCEQIHVSRYLNCYV